MSPDEVNQIRDAFTPNYPWVAADALINGDYVRIGQDLIAMTSRNHYDNEMRQVVKATQEVNLEIHMVQSYGSAWGYMYATGHAEDWFQNSGRPAGDFK